MKYPFGLGSRENERFWLVVLFTALLSAINNCRKFVVKIYLKLFTGTNVRDNIDTNTCSGLACYENRGYILC